MLLLSIMSTVSQNPITGPFPSPSSLSATDAQRRRFDNLRYYGAATRSRMVGSDMWVSMRDGGVIVLDARGLTVAVERP